MYPLIVGAAVISLAPVFVRLLPDLGPSGIAFYRCFLGALFILPFSWRSLSQLSKRQWIYAALAGLFFASDLMIWHRSIFLVGVGLATILANTQVFYLPVIGAVFEKEALSWRLAFAAGLSFAGVILLVGFDQVDVYRMSGLFFGLAAGFLYASSLFCLRRAGSKDSSLACLTVSSSAASFLIFVTLPLFETDFRLPSGLEWLWVGGLALLPQVLGWYLIYRFISRVKMAVAGLILLLQPILATLWGLLLFAEQMNWLQAVGAVLALAGIYLGGVSKRDRVRAVPEGLSP